MNSARARAGIVLGFVLTAWVTAAASTPPLDSRGLTTHGMGGKAGLYFEENLGQTDATVRFLSRGRGYTAFFRDRDVVFALRGDQPRPSEGDVRRDAGDPSHALRIVLEGAGEGISFDAQQPLPGQVNYLRGRDQSRWVQGARRFGRLEYRGAYRGVTLAFREGVGGELEYDVVVGPGADLSRVRLRFEGATGLEVGADGQLLIATPAGTLRQSRPDIYQMVADQRQPVPGGARLDPETNVVSFWVGEHDQGRELILDPTFGFSTYLGGSGPDQAKDVAVDDHGNVYVTGTTSSDDFPAGNSDPSPGRYSAFVTKFDGGGRLVYSSYYGGTAGTEYYPYPYDQADAIAVDRLGRAYFGGVTHSSDLPTPGNSIQDSFPGGLQAGFLAVLDAAGGLLYGTYLGGPAPAISGADSGIADIALDADGNVYLAGFTTEADFPGAEGTCPASELDFDAFLVKIAPLPGASLRFSRCLGGSDWDEGEGVAFDATTGLVFVSGTTYADYLGASCGGGNHQRAFLTAVDPTASGPAAIAWSTCTLWPALEAYVAADRTGEVYLAGSTTEFVPTTPDAFQPSKPGGVDGYIARFRRTEEGTYVRAYSSYLGGASGDRLVAVATGPMREVVVTGFTLSAAFPLVNPIQATLRGASDAFVAKFSRTLSGGTLPRFVTYLGGDFPGTGQHYGDYGSGIAAGPCCSTYVVGETLGLDVQPNFPTWKPYQPLSAGGIDSFVSKISDCDLPTVDPLPFDAAGVFGWSFHAEVSENDGLILEDVKLGHRFLAERISLPYINFGTTGTGGTQRLELMPASDTTENRSRLIDYQVGYASPGAEYAPFIVEATYVVDRLVAGAEANNLCVRQRYEFFPPIDEDIDPLLGCEPTPAVIDAIAAQLPPGSDLVTRYMLHHIVKGFTCARLSPTVAYSYHGQEDEHVLEFEAPVRLHLRPDAPAFDRTNATLFRDADSVLTPPPFSFESVAQERSITAIHEGPLAGDWDNLHLSHLPYVSLPAPPPGCPECAHMHWRWGRIFAELGAPWPPGDPTPGRPLVRRGSHQAVDVAMVKARLDGAGGYEETDPQDFRQLINGEPIAHADQVTWYAASSSDDADVFFTNGIYFSPQLAYKCDVAGWIGRRAVGLLFPAENLAAMLVGCALVPPASAGTLPAGFWAHGNHAYDVTGPEPAGGDVDVSLYVPDVESAADFSALRVFHNEGGVLVDRTASHDFEARAVFARVSSLGKFVVALPGTVRVDRRGDFDGDGKADLLWQNGVSGALRVWFMDGMERTGVASTVPAGPPSSAWAVRGLADFDGDGQSDILFHNTGTKQLMVWTMQGLQRSGAVIITPPRKVDVVGTGDFDDDGQSDIVVREQNTGQPFVWFMDGTTLVGETPIGPEAPPASSELAVVADLTGEGRPDIVWRDTGSGRLRVWEMEETNRSAEFVLVPDGDPAAAWRVAATSDFDQNGSVDLLWHNTQTGQLRAWYMQRGVRLEQVLPSPGQEPDVKWRLAGPR
jgi:hypothetical protein